MSALQTALRELLAGRRGARAQAWAWRLLAWHPGLRIARAVQRGQIRSPLAALRHGSRGLPGADRVRERLADMAAFCDAPLPAPAPPPAAPPPWNDRVLFALHHCGAWDPSGYASRSQALLGALAQRGVQPVVALRPGYPWDLARHRDVPRAPHVDHDGLRFELQPAPAAPVDGADGRYVAAYADRLEALARERGAVLLHAASNHLNGAAAALAARRLGCPSVYELRGLWHMTRAHHEPPYAGSEHYLYSERREIAACLAADHVVTLSPALAAWLAGHGVPRERITVVGNAATATPAPAAAGAALRQRLGLADGRPVVGYLGSLLAYEGLDDLLQAAARTPPAVRPQLLVVGDGPHAAALHHAVRRLGLQADVRFTGRVPADAVAAHYAAMDVVVLPRRDDPMTRLVPALKPFEALAHARPLLLSPALAQALGDTLPGGYRVADFAGAPRLDTLLAGPWPAPAAVPTWAERADTLLQLYRRLAGPPAPGQAPLQAPGSSAR